MGAAAHLEIISHATVPAAWVTKVSDGDGTPTLPPTPPDADPGDMIAMASTLAVGAWGDALAVVSMALRGHTREVS